ncbi:Crp/Fnr family transcriptional regulator [Roseovarius sp. CAU 1744]|uniref:Crp/Fnr family transcriptional regulator n=1 Tax=Roseovarius sp. CAU 1744 TaxID=3140368 RepID=UPI00325B99F0
MPARCKNCPLRNWPLFDPMTDEEVNFMQQFKTGEMRVDPGTTLMNEGSDSPQRFTTLKGKGLRFKTHETGWRQVISFVLPGEFIGLQGGVMNKMQHLVESGTRMILCVFDRKALWTLFRDHPGRAHDQTWMAALTEHVLGESMAALGQRRGIERISRALTRLYGRGAALGFLNGSKMPLPYQQQDLADALGLSLVRTNKALQPLRDRNIARGYDGQLEILKHAKLREIATLAPSAKPVVRPLI